MPAFWQAGELLRLRLRLIRFPLMRIFPLLCLGLASVMLLACSTTPPAPPRQLQTPQLPPPARSVVELPLLLDLQQLQQEVLQQLPQPLQTGSVTRLLSRQQAASAQELGPGSCSVTALNCRSRRARGAGAADSVEVTIRQQLFVRDLSLSLHGDQFKAVAEVEFSLETVARSALNPLGASRCGIRERMPRFQLEMSGSLSWGSQGEMVISPRPYAVNWQRRCAITAFALDVESVLELSRLRDSLQEQLYAAVFRDLRQSRLKASLQRQWPALTNAQALRPGQWLQLAPGRVALLPPQGRGGSIHTGWRLELMPVLVSGSRPPAFPSAPHWVDSVTGEGVHLAATGQQSLTQAGQRLALRLSEKLQPPSGQRLWLSGVRLYGHEERAVLALRLREPVRGEVFLLGRPRLDVDKNEVYFEGLSFTPASRDFLQSRAGWMLAMREQIQQKARFRFDEALAQDLQSLRSLQRDLGAGLRLKGQTAAEATPILFFGKDRLQAYVPLAGQWQLEPAAP